MSDNSYTERRKSRVKKLRQMIIFATYTVTTIPLAVSIYLFCNLSATKMELRELSSLYKRSLEEKDLLLSKIDEVESDTDIAELGLVETDEVETGQLETEVVENEQVETNMVDTAILASSNEEEEKPSTSIVYDKDVIRADEPRKVYLTFDDGPSIYTEEILNILDDYDVKATFFVTGQSADHPEWYKEIVKRGHTIGIHTYSHVYRELYRDKTSFIKDFQRIKNYVEDTTGVIPEFYRFPGGSSNRVSLTDMSELEKYVESQGMTYFDWNISSGDASKERVPSQTILNNSIASIGKYDSSIILLHDSGAKYTTVQALPLIIEKILAMDDVVILPITNKTEIIQHQ